MQRTVGNHAIIDEFAGVNDRVDIVKLPNPLVDWVHGMFPTKQGTMRRIPGKLLNSTTTTPGHILTITQLVFEEQTLVCIHASSVFYVENDMSLLVSSSSGVSPLSGFIDP